MQKVKSQAMLEQVIRDWMPRLRRRWPTKDPVITQLAPLRDYVACCDSYLNSSDGHLITLDSGYRGRKSEFIDILVHEYAHALQTESEPNGIEHSATWGVIYARLYTWASNHRAWPY
jgi:hypothetical protein